MTDSLSSIITVNESLSYTYDKNSLLGKGASSTVHKGTFKEEGVAVKRMKDELSDDDKKLLLNIKHENIVLVLCIENHLGLDHIVLELCLASFHQYFKEYEKVMNKFGGLTVVKKYMNQDAVKGLEYLHEQNIIHRDIKPGNILLVQKSSSSEVKAVLADFGLSTKLDDDQFSKTTLEGRGTLSWMAPELLREDGSERKFSRQSDIFSMGCVIYFAETDGSHPFDKGDSRGAVIHQNVKKYDPCDFCLLNDKPKAMDLIKKMIKQDRAARPSAIEVLQDPYFKEDGSQDTIHVHVPPPQLISAPQLIKGGEAPEGDTPQDTSDVLEEGHTSIPPEQSVPDASYGEQLYDVMTKMSHSLPRYIIDHYIRLLMIVNVKSDMKPDWSLSKRFLELYSTHASEASPQVAATYVYKILTGLGYEEMDEHNFRVYLHIELEIDTKITEELGKITEFRPTVIEVVRELDLKLGDYQKDRYRMVLTVLHAAVFDSNKSFFEYFTDLAGKLGKYPLAVAFTIGVLERSGWGDTKKLKPFSLPEFDLNTAYPEVDLCLTVADYYGNMSERDFSSAKVYTSAVHLSNQNVSKMSKVQFTLLLMERGAVKINDVSKIEDKVRYPIFFKEYKERCNRPSKETAPTTETVPTQETVVAQETVAQATSSQSPSTPTDQAEQPPAAEKVQPSFLIRVKNFLFPSSNRQEQEVPGTTTQTNTAPAPSIPESTDTAPTPSIPAAPAPTISNTSVAKEALAQKYIKMTDKLKNSILPKVASEALTVKSLDEVKSCLTLVCQEADWKKEVDAVKDEASLTEFLQRYCFLSNFSLLKCITEKLGLKESKPKIDQLAKERDAFYSEVFAKDFAAAAIEDHILIKEHHVEMTVVVSWSSSETTLATFDDYITEKFKNDDLSMFIALRAVHHSDLTFECTVPVWLEPAIGLALAVFVLGSGILFATLNKKKYQAAPTEESDTQQKGPPDWPEDDEIVKRVPETQEFHEDLVKDIKILLMPATPSEEDPVVYYLKQSPEKLIETYVDGLRIYIGNYGKSKVIVVMTAPAKSRQGPSHAGLITSKMLEKVPSIKYVVAVGVCFGMGKNQKLGDVIISDTICDFTNKREGVGENEYQRGPQHQVKSAILNKFRPPHGFEMPHGIEVSIGVLISTGSLIDNPDIKQELYEFRRDAIAGEMEGAGIMAAIDYAPESVGVIVIKGIGDWADGDKEATKKWKPFAARAAAHYVHAALNK